MKVTSKGQVTIPKGVRELLGIRPAETEVDFVEEGGKVVLVVDEGAQKERAKRRVDRMWGTATDGLTTEEIMVLTRGKDWNKAELS